MSSNLMVGARYVVLDGMDGAGKSLLIENLQKIFLPANKPFDEIRREENFSKYFVYTREPGGTDLGEKLRGIILNDVMFPFSELCLFFAQRMEVRKNIVAPALFAGVNVFSDRSESASFAYQICARNLGHLEDLFWKMNSYLEPFPTLYIFLDLDPKVAAQRMFRRHDDVRQPDKFEVESSAFFEKVRRGYLDFSTKVSVPCKYVNAQQSPEMVLAEVVALIREHIGLETITNGENVIDLSAVKRA